MSEQMPLSNDPLDTLRQALANVSVSPDFASGVRSRIASEPDALEDLRAELAAVTASPNLAVNVRQQIEEGRPRSGWSRLTWRWLVPAAGLAAAAVIAVVMWPRPATIPQAVNAVTGVPPPIVPGVTTQAPPLTRGAVTKKTPSSLAMTRVSDPGRVQPRDPMLEVITNQPEVLRRLHVSIAPGIAVDASEPAGMYEAPRIEIAPIEITPITLFVLPQSQTPLGVLPFILRVTADSAERSSR